MSDKTIQTRYTDVYPHPDRVVMLRSDVSQAVAAVGALIIATWLYDRERREAERLEKHSKQARSSKAASDVTELIGETPVVRLRSLSELTRCDIYAKLELNNPGGSAKDRIALAIIEAAEGSGQLRRGQRDCVFEGTSGSTGISLALICRARGYDAHIVVPDDTSSDKLNLLRMLGAHVHLVRPASIADSKHYVNAARSLAEKINGDASDPRQAIFANQFENDLNWKAHYRCTGPEIGRQVPEIDCFVSGAGTGGTIAGVSRYFEDLTINSKAAKMVKIVLADVPGSGLYNKVHFGVMYNNIEKEGTKRRHQVDTAVEGIGLNRLTANIKEAVIDDAETVNDEDSRYMATHLVENEGLFVGSSSAVAAVAAFRQALKLGPGHRIVLIFCDAGSRHLSKFWNLDLNPQCAVAQELAALKA